MEDLRFKEKHQENKKLKNKIIKYLKIKWIIIIIILLLFIIFPSETGKIIGQWIHNFIGNLIKYSQF